MGLASCRLWAGGRLVREFRATAEQAVRWAERFIVRSPHRSANVQVFRGGREEMSVSVTKEQSAAQTG